MFHPIQNFVFNPRWIIILSILIFNNQDFNLSGSGAAAVKIQADSFRRVPDADARARKVKEAFKNGFHSYKRYAWGFDEVGALTLNGSNSRNGWGATIVDSLSTLQLMGLTEEFGDALQHIKRIDFSQTESDVSFFETSIRYLGGMLSAYETSARSQPVLLRKSIELADRLMFAWQNGSSLPFGYMNFTENYPITTDGKNETNLAEAGSLILEYYKLSSHSHNSTYFEKADSTMKAIMNSPTPWPGLHATFLNPKNAAPLGGFISWGAAADSYYEYLNKFSLMTGNKDPRYLKEWELAVDSSIKHLIRSSAPTTGTCPLSFLSIPLSSKGKLYMSSFDSASNKTDYSMSHLACFVGGNFMLGGKMLRNRTIVDYGLKLAETCAESYSSSRSSVGSEIFGFVDRDTRRVSAQGQLDLNQYDKTGFFHSGGYVLRPEVIESMFYAYRITGDPKWQDFAWKAFLAIKSCCEVSESTGLFAPLLVADRIPTRDFEKSRGLLAHGSKGWEDGSQRALPEYGNWVESFWWAETLKYLYLIFLDPSTVSLDEFVFTTEGHPIRIEEAWVDPGTKSEDPVSLAQSILTVGDWIRLVLLVGISLLILRLWKRCKNLIVKLRDDSIRRRNVHMVQLSSPSMLRPGKDYELAPSQEPDDSI